MRGSLDQFLREVRDGFDHFDETVDWQDWLDKFRKNVVALTIVFCFVVITGSCVAVPVIGLMRASNGESAAQDSAGQDGGDAKASRNPWSLDKQPKSPEG
ncbi:MAG: hypothetical protein KDE32_07895 [Novosphingobium sp.]|nr:hypothetical protein [Novosphingobium sp.]